MQFAPHRAFCTRATLLALAAVFAGAAGAQVSNPTTIAPGVRSVDVLEADSNGFSLYQIKPVQRTLTSIDFFVNDGPSGIKFEGTDLARPVTGKAKVEAKTGRVELSMSLDHLSPANGFGPEYLTYVLWAISADGRAQNLGELDVHGTKGDLKASTSLQSFGLIVTAEPYFSVSQPSDVVVAQSVPTKRTSGVLQQVNTHYSLLPRGLYANTSGSQTVANPVKGLPETALAIAEADNAQRIALAAGAAQYAPDIMAEVGQDVGNAKLPGNGRHGEGSLSVAFARQATQRAEDARISTLHKQAAERLRQAQQQAQQQALDAQAQVDAARAAQAQAEAQRDQALSAAQQAQAAADQARRNAAATQMDAAALRAKLRAQLNAILSTTETARGLIVNLSGVLFDTGKSTLKPNAQLRLTKVATILAIYPTLRVDTEGYTDSTGSNELNQKLSDDRAHAVADFLTANGVPAANVTATGFGKASPVATNATAAGRAKNRRVSLVVSGSAIGIDRTSRP